MWKERHFFKVNDAPFPSWTTALSTGKDVSKLPDSEEFRILQKVSYFFILPPFVLNSIIWLQNEVFAEKPFDCHKKWDVGTD